MWYRALFYPRAGNIQAGWTCWSQACPFQMSFTLKIAIRLQHLYVANASKHGHMCR